MAHGTKSAYSGSVDARVAVAVGTGERYSRAGDAVSAATNHDLRAHGIELRAAHRDSSLQRDDLVANEVPTGSKVLRECNVIRGSAA